MIERNQPNPQSASSRVSILLRSYRRQIEDCTSTEVWPGRTLPPPDGMYRMSGTSWDIGGIARHERSQDAGRRLCFALDQLVEADLLSLDEDSVSDLSWALGPAAQKDSDFLNAPLAAAILNALRVVGDSRVLELVE